MTLSQGTLYEETISTYRELIPYYERTALDYSTLANIMVFTSNTITSCRWIIFSQFHSHR